MSKRIIAMLLAASMCLPLAALAAEDAAEEPQQEQPRIEEPAAPAEPIVETTPEPVIVTPEPIAEATPEPVIVTPEPVVEITPEPTAAPEAPKLPEKPEQPKKPETPPTYAPDVQVTSQPQATETPRSEPPTQQPGYNRPGYDQPPQPEYRPGYAPPPGWQPQPRWQPQPEPRTRVIEKVIIVTPQEARTSFDQTRQLRETSQMDARDCIDQIKSLFRSADPETKLEILAEIGQLKKELNDEAIGVFVNGIDLDFAAYDNAQPYIKNDITLVPLRAVADALNADIRWDDKIRKITMTKGSKAVIMQIDNRNATVNGRKYELEAPPEINNDRTMVPLRFISEALDSDVQWDSGSRTVIIDNDDELEYDDED